MVTLRRTGAPQQSSSIVRSSHYLGSEPVVAWSRPSLRMLVQQDIPRSRCSPYLYEVLPVTPIFDNADGA
jgi:hypothetical protein